MLVEAVLCFLYMTNYLRTGMRSLADSAYLFPFLQKFAQNDTVNDHEARLDSAQISMSLFI